MELGTQIALTALFVSIVWNLVQYRRFLETRKIENCLHFVAMTERFHSIEKLFMQYKELSSLAREVYRKSGYPSETLETTDVTTHSPQDTLRKHELEFHVCALMIQLMEDVWSVHDLSKDYNNVKMSGWMTLFYDWYNSDIFKKYFEKLKYIYSEQFYDFVNNTVKNYTPRRDRSVALSSS